MQKQMQKGKDMIALGIGLKKCPVCGKDSADFATIAEEESCGRFEDIDCPKFESFYPCNMCGYFMVVCNMQKGGCGLSTRYFKTKEEAAEAWNRRAE